MTRQQTVRRWVTVALMSGAFATVAATHAEAQRWGRPNAPRAGACFYRDANFRGDYFCVAAGDAIESLPRGMNDEISSIRTFGGGLEVTIFQDPRFRGRSERIEDDVRNLRSEGWNDKLSSLRVDRSRGSRFGRGNGQGNGNAERIVRRAYQDILNREPDQDGMRSYRSHIIDDDWSEEQVRDALRKSPEYRTLTTMTRQRATEIVRRAYRSVLDREPDAASQNYIDRVMRDKWTEDDVVRELRKSPEARERARRR